MKLPCILIAIVLPLLAPADDIKMKNGTVVKGTPRYNPSSVEITTATGKVSVPFSSIDPAQTATLFPDAPEIILQSERTHGSGSEQLG